MELIDELSLFLPPMARWLLCTLRTGGDPESFRSASKTSCSGRAEDELLVPGALDVGWEPDRRS